MKIKQLKIENFRSLRNVCWIPGDLNVIIGPNGTGKSNLLRFLELISMSALGKLARYIQSSGGMAAIVWDGSDGQNLIPVLHTLYTSDRAFKNDIDSAMRAAFGDEFEELVFPPASDQRIQMRIRWKSLKREQSASELSDGTLRFLFLLTIMADPSPATIIAIDEPETGLHPSMLPLVAEFSVDAARKSQIILTTHSPQLLDAFTDKKLITTIARWENGETVLKTLKGSDLEYWLNEYTLGALYKTGELEQMK